MFHIDEEEIKARPSKQNSNSGRSNLGNHGTKDNLALAQCSFYSVLKYHAAPPS
jgi:hypothetical protein